MVRTHERASLSSARRPSDDPALLPSGPLRARAVAPSDRELLRRLLRIQVTREFTSGDALSASARRRRGGWTLQRRRAGFCVLSRRWDTWGAGGPPVLATVAAGTLPVAVEQLARLLRAPGESEMNALLRGAFGASRAIYGSLLRLVAGRDRRALLPSTHADAQLAVRSATFAHSRLASLLPAWMGGRPGADAAVRNDQLCVAEFFEPTDSGFVVRYASLPARELRAGVAPAECVAELHPFTAWLVAERVAGRGSGDDRVRVTFRVTFHGADGGGCSTRRAAKWMARAAEAVTRLGDVVRAAFRGPAASAAADGPRGRASSYKGPGTGVGVGVGVGVGTPGMGMGMGMGTTAADRRQRAGHRNWRCVACTRSLVGVFRRPWRRCDLCAYSVCAADSCCSLGQVAIYNRYVAPLLVCRRCRECVDAPDAGDAAFADLRDHRERGSSPASPAMWAISTASTRAGWGRDGGREGREADRHRRRALSDPPFVPTLELTSSGEDHSGHS